MSEYVQSSEWEAFMDTMDWTPDPNEPVFDESAFKDMDWLDQEGWGPILDYDFSLLPDVPAAPVEPTSFSCHEHGHGLAGMSQWVFSSATLHEDRWEHNVYPKNHKRDTDISDHCQIQGPSPFSCAHCNEILPDKARLTIHGQNIGHKPFKCSCGDEFSRLDALRRHCASGEFPCTACKDYQGKDSFTRQDHLVQHLRGRHSFDEKKIKEILPSYKPTNVKGALGCPDTGCDFHRPNKIVLWSQVLKQKYPRKQSEFTKHLKSIHNTTAFPCREIDCERNGAKGYVSKEAFMKHMAKDHPNVAPYSPTPAEWPTPIDLEVKYDCTQCGENFFGRIALNATFDMNMEANPRQLGFTDKRPPADSNKISPYRSYSSLYYYTS